MVALQEMRVNASGTTAVPLKAMIRRNVDTAVGNAEEAGVKVLVSPMVSNNDETGK